MNILSLFDGMSCAQIALERCGIKYDKYFASEIDKYAIKVTQNNYPKTIQLGDVTKVSSKNISGKIGLLVAGSPCQGFSFAGKQLNFEDPRSKLFFEFVRIKNELNPDFFLLENVLMKQECQDVISQLLGVRPIQICSSLVSAQRRVRLYWTNIPYIFHPTDRGILLKDILDSGSCDRKKSLCIDANYFKGGSWENYQKKKKRQMIYQLNDDKSFGGKQPRHQDRIYADFGKSPCLTTLSSRTNVAFSQSEKRLMVDTGIKYRKLTVSECEKLQTVPVGYTSCVSNSQAYKMLGNGFTVDVICHILEGLKCQK